MSAKGSMSGLEYTILFQKTDSYITKIGTVHIDKYEKEIHSNHQTIHYYTIMGNHNCPLITAPFIENQELCLKNYYERQTWFLDDYYLLQKTTIYNTIWNIISDSTSVS